MKHYVAVLLLCLGLILARAPLSFSDYSAVIGSGEYGVAFGYDCSCYPSSLISFSSCYAPWQGDGGCEGLSMSEAVSQECIQITPECQCAWLGRGECDTDGGDPDGGGLTQAQIEAIAIVIAALQNAQTYAGDATAQSLTLNNLFNSLANLQTTLSDSLGQLSGAVNTISNSLSTVAGYLQQGQSLGPQAFDIVEQQLITAVLQRGLADADNRNEQGYSANDPVLIASGFESYKVEDLAYKAINNMISISRQFRSNQTDLKSSFGRSWFFNYDTNIVAGRTPLIKEHEILTADLQQQAQQLANLATIAVMLNSTLYVPV